MGLGPRRGEATCRMTRVVEEPDSSLRWYLVAGEAARRPLIEPAELWEGDFLCLRPEVLITDEGLEP